MIEFEVLGPLRIRRDGRLVRLDATMLRRVLAVLLARTSDTASVEVLLDALWSGMPPRTARKTIQIYVHRLRKLLGPGELITCRTGGYRLAAPAAALDATRFEVLVQRAREDRKAGEFASAREMLHAALELWRGPAFAEFSDLAFAQAAIQRLTERRLVAFEERAELDLLLGQHVDLAYDLRPLIAEHPFRDRLREHLMLALYRSGRLAAALEAYHETRKLFWDELGLPPGRRLQDLHQALLRADACLDWSADQITTAGPSSKFSSTSQTFSHTQ